MSDTALRQVYRVDPGDVSCRSAVELAVLNTREIPDVDSVSIAVDGTLIVVSNGFRDLYDDLIRAALASGLDPESVTEADLERIVDTTPLSIDDLRRAGLIEFPKEPARAVVHQVQRISVQVTDGYDPDTIIIAAGIPTEITFSEGHGCLAEVVFDSLGISADLEGLGAVVSLPPLEAGTYPFRCGMDMVHGTVIAE